MRSPTQNLLSDVERFLRRTRMSHTRFGLLAAWDPNLVGEMRRGRELRHATEMKVRRTMSALERRPEKAGKHARA